jgi:NAD(P)-dependent dehydrogenase (short-subunit alcohol dehydrogenase family)
MNDRTRTGAGSPPLMVEIRVRAWLEDGPSARWFPGFSLRRSQGGESLLRGPLPDQAALFGVLHRLRDLAIPLRSVNILAGEKHGRAASAAHPHIQGDPSMNAVASAPAPHPAGESVLITGCSSGIGLATALSLAAHGFHVLAAVRREPDAERLRGFHLSSLEPVCPLDLTDPAQIAAAAASIKESLARKGRDRLYAIIHNAGGGFIAPVELMDTGRFRAEMEARVIGPVALLQSLLPLVRRARGGRILWISTPAMVAIPYVASINACEFAMNCVAQNLHLELSPWRIPSILIGCGGIRTAAPGRTKTELEESLRGWPRETSDLYAKSLQKLQDQFAQFDDRRTEPEAVAKVVYAALTAEKPKRKYLVGHQAGLLNFVSRLPQSVVEGIFQKRI